MKQIFLWVVMITTTFYTYSQTLNYNEIGLLISKDNNFGTARFNAMGGAFGALGGDISSLSINPAGMAIARNSKVSVTLGVKDISSLINYYSNSNTSESSFFNIEQGGSVFVFDSYYTNSNWNRFALSFNYRLKADFDNFYEGTGNSERLFFTEHIGDLDSPKNRFDSAIGQDFSNKTKGQSSVFNFGFSAVHNKKLYVGASLNFHNFNYTQTAYLLEENDDVNGNILIAENYNDTFLDGDGFSVGFGFIYKINKNIRFGLAYETLDCLLLLVQILVLKNDLTTYEKKSLQYRI